MSKCKTSVTLTSCAPLPTVAHKSAHGPTQPKLATLWTTEGPRKGAERADASHGAEMGNVSDLDDVADAPAPRATKSSPEVTRRNHFTLEVHHNSKPVRTPTASICP